MNTREEMQARYVAAMHAMQTGVKVDQGMGSDDGTPKHLRVGVNSALVNDAALVRLLVAKGVITDDEYVEAVTLEMEAEAARYQVRLRERFGHDGVHLA